MVVEAVNAANTAKKENENGDINYNLLRGKLLASAPPGDEVVITGMAGAFPSSNNMFEFRDHLFNKDNMVQPNRRWRFQHPEIPTASGTIPDVKKFDAGFFGIHERQTQSLDTMGRLIIERAVEAIFDAGMHPEDLQKVKTGVYIGTCFSESEKSWFFDNLAAGTFAWTGVQRTMIAHRLSYFLKLKGPSFCTDTACSSSLYALEHAFRAIRYGEIDVAIVGGVNLCFHPFVSLQFARLGVLSLDGNCKTFDASGNGYARSEAAAVIILQRARDGKRVYGEIVHAKTSCDGYKEQGITYPSGMAQQRLLREFYDECEVDKTQLSFLEAHGTGTFVGDPEECGAIDEILTKGRATPLLVGSVKSNIGHSEPASGLCSIAKCVIGMETGYIPPNLHFNTPRPEIKALIEGRIKVVSEKMPFEDDRGLLGVNSFGFGGGNCHILLRKNKKEKVNRGLPADDIPRLVCISGRTHEAASCILDELKNEDLDVEHIRLLHDVFRKNIDNHLYRGYTILSKSGEICRYIEPYTGTSTALYIAFGDLKNWYDVGADLLALPVFSDSIQRIQKILSSKNVDIMHAIKKECPERQINHLLGSVIVQIGIIEVMKHLEIKPDGQLGFTFGELASAYFDGVLTMEEAVYSAHAINQSLNDIDDIYNSNTEQVNGHTTVANETFIEDKAPPIPTAPKSESLIKLKKKLLQSLSAILPKPKPWKQFGESGLKYASAEYFINSLSKNSHKETIRAARKSNAIVLRIGNIPSMKNARSVKVVPFIPTNSITPLLDVIKAIGNLYINGHNPQVYNLYPKVQYPVSRGTRMISPYIKWKHDRDWFIPEHHLEARNQAQEGARVVNVLLGDHVWAYVDGHVIDGRNLFPATGYLYVVWETLSIIREVPITVMNVVFEDCRFLRATTVPKKGIMKLIVTIQKESGNFEVVEGDAPVVKGRIYLKEDADKMSKESWSFDEHIEQDMIFNTKDIYKELRLRGYNYTKGFRSIQKTNLEATNAYICWDDNWVTFMDNMLQLKILQEDSRFLYVPTYIRKLTIPAKSHLRWVNESYFNKGLKPILPVICQKDTSVIRCGDISIVGLLASSIPRRKDLGVPVLEKYVFVPNETALSIEESVRVNTQLIIENGLTYKVKGAELIDAFTPPESIPISPLILQVLGDQPLIQPLLKILSSTPIECSVAVEDKKLSAETDCLMVIASGLLKRGDVLSAALKSVKDNGFLISREPLDFDVSSYKSSTVTIFTVHRTASEIIVLLKKVSNGKACNVIKISESDEFNWVSKVQDIVKMKPNEDIVLYTENEPESGILGLTNCLRREPETSGVRCFHLQTDNIRFDLNDKFIAEQLQKKMAINIFRNGTWGTFRHLLIEQLDLVQSEHCLVNVTTRGDLSSLRWIEGPLRHDTPAPEEKRLLYVYYSALNFRDIMTASGKINADSITRNRCDQECVQGFEYSGKDAEGNRYCGVLTHGALSTMVMRDVYLSLKIPDFMSLEDAATIPTVYLTVIYAVIERGQMKRGESILIHAGTGGIGQAAIAIALYYGCDVYTTCGTQEKKEFLLSQFPQLKESHIGNSRDTSFEQMVYKETAGRGVDLVLNSLAEEKLIASIRCLARGGRFLEIGKFDLANNNEASLLLFRKECCFLGVMLDQFFTDTPKAKKMLSQILTEAMHSGAVKPLVKTIFKYDEVEKAFRYMGSGKHKGKVLIQLREPDAPNAPPEIKMFTGIPRYFCYPETTYIIVGGLGGFGLELADWLILRGARKLVLTSRKGATTGYQLSRIRVWRSYGTRIQISKADITTEAGCTELLRNAQKMGDVAAIFNLAVVLADSAFENQTADTFRTSFAPKAVATEHLDRLSRQICPKLTDFVIFSSVTCGRGNAGQTNYGMANSVMERICERRRRDGYPALAIEWGAIGEVGLVADMQEDQRELEISGTLQQRLPSCFEVLNKFLRYRESPIVSSMVVAEKRSGAGAADNIVDAVISILGLHDSKSVSLHATLAELGMDSITAVEIKQTLEREYEVFLSAKDMRSMTLAKLKAIQEDLSEGTVKKAEKTFGIEIMFRAIGVDDEFDLSEMIMDTKVDSTSKAPKIFMIPGIEGFAKLLRPLAQNLEVHATCLQFDQDTKFASLQDFAESLVPTVLESVSKDEPVNIVAYSYGCLVGLELVHLLERQGYTGTLICIDGAPLLMKEMMIILDTDSVAAFETMLVCHLMSFYISNEDITKNQERLFRCSTWEERVNTGMDITRARVPLKIESQKRLINGVYTRLNLLRTYQPTQSNLSSQVCLIKPSIPSVPDLPEDYSLSKLCGKVVEVTVLEGNHATVLENDGLSQIINSILIQKN